MTGKFAVIVILIALGYLLKRINILKEEDNQVLAKLVLNVTLPALVIVNLNKAELDISLSVLPVMMVIYGIIAHDDGITEYRLICLPAGTSDLAESRHDLFRYGRYRRCDCHVRYHLFYRQLFQQQRK